MSIGDLEGTTSDVFEVGNNGPLLKNEGGVLAVRNPTDTEYQRLKGLTPVDPEDLTTKAYVDALVGRFLAGAFGADWRINDLGEFALVNSTASNNPQNAGTPGTRLPIAVDGTLKIFFYSTENGNANTQFKIHVNGVVQETLTLISRNANGIGAEAINVPVLAGDYVQVEYDAGAIAPRDSLIYLIQE